MRIIRSYGFVLALALAVIYAYAPLRLEDLAKIRWLDDISALVNKSLVPRREASVSPIDPVAAANVDEDLDYRIAQRTKSADGWRSFLAAHPDGSHAQSARTELGRLVPPEQAPASRVAVASNAGSPDARALSEAALPIRPSLPTEGDKPASDELCKRDEDRLRRLSVSPTSDEAVRLVSELRCEKLRPELFRLTEHLDYRDSGAVGAAESRSSKVAEAGASGRRATDHRDRRWRAVERRRHASRWASPGLPPILMALFGEPPRTSTAFRRIRASRGGSSSSGGVGVAAATGGAPGGAASAASASGGGSGGGAGGGNAEMAGEMAAGTAGGMAAETAGEMVGEMAAAEAIDADFSTARLIVQTRARTPSALPSIAQSATG